MKTKLCKNGRSIMLSDLDDSNEIRLSVKDNSGINGFWLNKDNMMSLKIHLDVMLLKLERSNACL